ncbi:hypothetical protein GCM10028812_53390 [Ancylobacter sonchi]
MNGHWPITVTQWRVSVGDDRLERIDQRRDLVLRHTGGGEVEGANGAGGLFEPLRFDTAPKDTS